MYNFNPIPGRTGRGTAKWNAMRAECPEVSDDIVPFSIADMELWNAPEITAAIRDYLETQPLCYPRPTESYYASVCSWMKRRHAWNVQPEWIVQFGGVVPALFALVELLTDLSDGVILLTPCYPPFYEAVNGRRLVDVPLKEQDRSYVIDYDALEAAAKDPDNKLIILSNPHNPVGRAWSGDELEKISEICLRNQVFVISDEIHGDLIFPGYRHTCYATVSDEALHHCAVCAAPSKTFNLAGLQTSSIIIENEEVRRRLHNLMKRRGFSSLNSVGYVAAEAAYTKGEPWLEELIQHLEKNRRFLHSFLRENIPEIKPFRLEGTYLQWLDCRGLGLDEQSRARFMREKARMFWDEGYLFGTNGKGFARLNIACPTVILQAALERLQKAVKENLR
jgi:putative C-S lyase